MPLLFSYGTLQQPEVQQANYGRLLDGAPDALLGYRLEPLAISDPDVLRVSGKVVHSIARPSGNLGDRIVGVRFTLTEAELAATDRYEVDAYARAEVVLESGVRAFVYVGATPVWGTACSLKPVLQPPFCVPHWRMTSIPTRRDGWTVARQARFLQVLAATRSVTRAASAVGMSRESAHRLRARDPDGLFAAMWARALPPVDGRTRAEVDQGHIRVMALACGAEGANLVLALQHGQHRDLRDRPAGAVARLDGPRVEEGTWRSSRLGPP